MKIFLIFLALGECFDINYYKPEQVHISLGKLDTEMTVTWASQYPSPYASVEYFEYPEKNASRSSTKGTWTHFPNLDYPHILQRILYTCHATMSNLSLSTLYNYRVGSDEHGWSPVFSFRSKKDFSKDPISRVIIYGDLGISPENELTLDSLINETQFFDYDAIIHNGDFAYDFNSNNGQKGDRFMREIEPIASKVPYMVSIGNHEKSKRILHYYYRFTMPSDHLNLFYSFNLGKVHFLAYSTELVFDKWTYLQKTQEKFIKADLASFDRTKHPWLVVFGHRPLYCSANLTTSGKLPRTKPPWQRNNGDCLTQAPTVRHSFEKLWNEFGVDLVVSSHVHAYERLRTVNKGKVVACEEESFNRVARCKAPVHVISGNPGQDESYAPVSPTPLDFSVFQDDHVGFGRITAFNESHLLWEQVVSNSSEVIDYLWILK